jgi:Spy/CpxP family protein refolding chaperone
MIDRPAPSHSSTVGLRAIAFATVILAGGVVLAQHHADRPAQPYAGQQARAIASLSAEELRGFLEGRGMGLARAGDLNGYPGPMHVLELEKELKLTPHQRREVEAAFERMRARATDLGRRYVDAERAVDAAFRSDSADAATITARVMEANRLLGEVRLSHLAAHLAIAPLLTPEQRARYAELRGYGSDAKAAPLPKQ